MPRKRPPKLTMFRLERVRELPRDDPCDHPIAVGQCVHASMRDNASSCRMIWWHAVGLAKAGVPGGMGRRVKQPAETLDNYVKDVFDALAVAQVPVTMNPDPRLSHAQSLAHLIHEHSRDSLADVVQASEIA